MMRQLGGSFGVALLTTLIHIKSGKVRGLLLENINPYNTGYVQRHAGMVSGFMAQGKSSFDAQQMANKAMDGLITKQTMLVTYDSMYLLIGVFVLFCIPIVYLQKFKKNTPLAVDAH
jgi:DHA2 family multidrug resistance protein